MTRVRVSRAARADLERILSVRAARWGDLARGRYEQLLVAAIGAIAHDPTAPTTQDRATDLTGARSLHLRHVRRVSGVKAPVHVIYYRAHSMTIEIIRVLHERIDPAGELGEPQPREAGRARRRRR